MRTTVVSALLFLGIYSPISHSAVYNVDPTQSYISLPVHQWEKGPFWNFLLPDGGGEIALYEWVSTFVDERIAVSGNIEVLMQPEAVYSRILINVNAQKLSSSVPAELNFNIPSRATLDPVNGMIVSVEGCHGVSDSLGGGAGVCLVPSSSYSGTLQTNDLTLSGGRSGVLHMGGSVYGGLEPPPTQTFLYTADTWYSFHIVATMVPEPSSALMLVAGLTLLLSSRRHVSRR